MQEMNQMRQKVMIYSAISIACIILGFLLFMSIPAVGGLLFVGGGVGLFAVSATVGSKFRLRYKEKVCKTVMEKMFDVEVYDPTKGFDRDYVRDTYLVPSGNQFSSDDYLRASYKGYHFERSDVCIEDEHTDSNGHKSTTTLFKGSWTVFTFPKKISSYLLIREKGFFSGGKPGGLFSNAPYTEKVTFEDVDFNKRFEVYAEDEHDAFYVLTPHFMEKIKELELMEDGKMIIGFIDSEIHVLFDNRENALEPSILREVTEEDFELVEREMQKIVSIMDILDLIEK